MLIFQFINPYYLKFISNANFKEQVIFFQTKGWCAIFTSILTLWVLVGLAKIEVQIVVFYSIQYLYFASINATLKLDGLFHCFTLLLIMKVFLFMKIF